MAITQSHEVDPRFLPADMHNLVWTDFEDTSLLKIGTVVFDHSSHAYYAGRVSSFSATRGRSHPGRDLVWVDWYKTVDQFMRDGHTPEHLLAMNLWWADPVMQEE